MRNPNCATVAFLDAACRDRHRLRTQHVADVMRAREDRDDFAPPWEDRGPAYTSCDECVCDSRFRRALLAVARWSESRCGQRVITAALIGLLLAAAYLATAEAAS